MKAPASLSAAAVAVWQEMAPELERKRLAPAMVEAVVMCVTRMRDAQARIDAEGMIVSDEKGRPVPHPALAIEAACRKDLKGLLGR